MANQEHLEILKQGVEVWNQWRKQYPQVQPDLSSTILCEANLSGINLTGAILCDSSLSGTTRETIPNVV